jgi:hypothetical protein
VAARKSCNLDSGPYLAKVLRASRVAVACATFSFVIFMYSAFELRLPIMASLGLILLGSSIILFPLTSIVVDICHSAPLDLASA